MPSHLLFLSIQDIAWNFQNETSSSQRWEPSQYIANLLPAERPVQTPLYILIPHSHSRMPDVNWKVLDNFPLLMYILAAKTLLLCLGFACVKIYQSKKIEAKLKLEREERLKKEAEKDETEKKDDWGYASVKDETSSDFFSRDGWNTDLIKNLWRLKLLNVIFFNTILYIIIIVINVL